jgi:hypothetical protein
MALKLDSRFRGNDTLSSLLRRFAPRNDGVRFRVVSRFSFALFRALPSEALFRVFPLETFCFVVELG